MKTEQVIQSVVYGKGDIVLDDALTVYLEATNAYEFGDSIMTDKEYDSLELYLENVGAISSLRELSNDSDNLYDLVYPMQSIATYHEVNMQSKDDMVNAIAKHFKHTNNEPLAIFDKFDGVAFQAIYEHGKLKHILSRGKRTKGFDITDRLKHTLPDTITDTRLLAFIGEALISTDDFINSLAHLGYKNERNTAAGLINATKDIAKQVLASKFLQTRIFKVAAVTPYYNTIKVAVAPLVAKHYPEFNNFADCIIATNYIEAAEAYKKISTTEIEFRTDGVVLVAPSYATDIHNGLYSGYMAIKPKAEETITKIIGIHMSLRNDGTLNPVALLEPVDLDGSEVKKAQLFNYRNMLESGLFIGAEVVIKKSGDIIPHIERTVTPAEPTEEWKAKYANCEYDGVNLISDEDVERVKFIRGMHMLNLKDVGTSKMNQLYDAGYKTITDLFNFNEASISGVFGSDDSITFNKVSTAIRNRFSKLDLQHLILSMRFNGIGHKNAIELAKSVKSVVIDNEDFPHYSQKLLRECLESDDFIKFVDNIKLLQDRINWTGWWNNDANESNDDKVIKVCLTGSTKACGYSTKAEFVNSMESTHNIKLQEVSVKDATVVITNDTESNSGKAKQARQLSKTLLTYNEFAINLQNMNA